MLLGDRKDMKTNEESVGGEDKKREEKNEQEEEEEDFPFTLLIGLREAENLLSPMKC